jgi:hypothetical protein
MRSIWMFSLAMCLVACKSVGDSCDDNVRFRCLDAQHELACRNGTLIAAPCAGPAGCVNHGMRGDCDVAGNHEGDPCGTGSSSTGISHRACAPDGKSQIMCRAGSYVRILCRGSRGCETGKAFRPGDHTLDSCDNSVANENDTCDGDDELVCSVDRSAILKCVKGRWRTDQDCSAKDSCTSKSEYLGNRITIKYSCR